uniref:Dynein regulatory complex protein 10 n=1 Tax=Astyanax mexicanus TaxID=7994 RepID=A0A8B9JYZ6_ASTMX
MYNRPAGGVVDWMNKVIQWLRSSILKTEKCSDDFVVRKQKEAERHDESVQKTSELKQTRLQEEVNQLKVQLKNLIIQHRDAELALRKKSYKVETEVQNWIEKYDAEMGEKQTKLEEITQIHEEEMAELSELQEYYAVRELEFSKIMEEHRIEQERRDEEEREREVQSRAAIIIQAFWRGWCVRKAMKAKTKGQKNKKGKGKKGK